ncbi:MAG: YIP1 family protein [Armatimonadetes bacterium]|nr:YIP1 family protein [Armatimonadota bacterium]
MMERIGLVWNWLSEATSKLSSGWRSWSQTRFVQSFLESWIWGFMALVRPVPTLQKAAEEKPVLSALWLTILQGFSLAIGTKYAADNAGFVASWLIKNLPSWWLVVLYAFIFPPVLWFVKASVLNLVAELLGGPPRGLSLLATTAVACSPLLLILPAALIAVAIAEPDLNTGFVSHLWFVFAIGVHAWWVVLTVVAIRETYRFTIAQAFLTILLPALIGLPMAYIIYSVLSVVA